MADIEVPVSGSTGDTEIDLYADFAESELEAVRIDALERMKEYLCDYSVCNFQGTGDDYITHNEQIPQDGDLYDDVITTQSSETDFPDVAGTTHPNVGRIDHSNGSGGSLLSNSYAGKRVSLYVGQLTWVSDGRKMIRNFYFISIVDNRYRFS